MMIMEICIIFVNEQDVSTAIRTPEVTALVSQVAAISEVRQKNGRAST